MYSTRITLAAFCPLPTRKLFVWRPQHRAALQRKADAEADNLSSVVDPKCAAPQVAGQGAEVMYAVVVPQRGVYGQTAGVGGSNDGAALAHDLPACVDGRRVAEPVRAGQRSEIHDPALCRPAERPRQERVVLSQPDHHVLLVCGPCESAATRVDGAELAKVLELSARAREERNRETTELVRLGAEVASADDLLPIVDPLRLRVVANDTHQVS